jgi:hypothetical protein
LPEFNWYQIFNMAGYVLPPEPPTMREARDAAWWAAQEQAAKEQLKWCQVCIMTTCVLPPPWPLDKFDD